jgi:hypothetical protein
MTADRGGWQPVVPGDPERSELVRRIGSTDDDVVMPPPRSGLVLSTAEKALLRRWIEEGADYAPHWAFVPPKPTPVPSPPGPSSGRNPIDAFVVARLSKAELTPAPPAAREAVIRRVSLDLTGVPPTPAEVDAFLADTAEDAYQRLVERLLASPRFGERMALMWLDAARYADTNGFHHDNERTAWPYRDWVIRAFNDNMPYDQFVVEQLAGDLLEDATQQQRIATAFCRMHNINDEGGALDDEYRVEAVCDRIETIATTFLGLTFTCCRCHDHKYDPFDQEDYYSLYAYFNSVEERGVYPNDFEQARAYPARLAYFTPELERRLAGAEEAQAAAAAKLQAAEPAVRRERAEWERAFRAERGVEWVDLEQCEATSEAGLELLRQDDGSVRVLGTADVDTHTLVLRTTASGMRLLRFEALLDALRADGRTGLAPNGNAVVTSIAVEAVSVRDPSQRQQVRWAWAWADHAQGDGDHDVANLLDDAGDDDGWALAGHLRQEPRTALLWADVPFGYDGGTVLRVRIGYHSRYQAHIAARPRISCARVAADLLPDFPVVLGDWWQAGPFAAADFDAACSEAFGPEQVARIDPAARWGEGRWQHQPGFADGVSHALEGERAAFYLGRSIWSPVERKLDLSLGSDDALWVYLNGVEVHANKALRGVAPDQDRVEVTLRPGENALVLKVVNNEGPAGFYCRPAPLLPAPMAAAATLEPERRGPRLDAAFALEWAARHSPTYAALHAELERRNAAVEAIRAQAAPVSVMQERAEPEPTFVLRRGRYDAADDSRPVRRRPPRALGGELPPGAPNNRLGFARWLVQPDNPLTARVHVNRLWQMLFGTGIVKSSENFGHQADWPSHPDLLDWLARWFVASGWDQKALLRLIVTSDTYLRSAVVSDVASAADPENRLLAYFPRQRLPGELVRDQALYVAGLLHEQIGGPSVRPYQPPGLWREVSIGSSSNTQVFERDDGEALYRRSLYTFWKRTSPSPQMATFDAPTREYCVVRRATTNTPLQALVLWNDEQFVEAARVLAQRTLAEEAQHARRLELMFRRCTGRRPDAEEQAVLERTFRGLLARFEQSPADAEALLEQGEAPRAEQPVAELAAWTLIANCLLSLDETLVRG